MAKDRPKQLNVRLEDGYWDVVERLIPVIEAETGIAVGVADIVRLGLRELERKYLVPAKPAKPKKGE